MYECRSPKNEKEFTAYYQLRWQLLRQPWQQALGSEKDELEAQSYHRVVVDEQQNVVGVGRLHKSSQYCGHVRYMAIDSNFQGKGLGQMLMNELEHTAARLGVTNIELNARENAIEFYQKLGYKNNGFSHLLYGKIKHDKMSKVLTYLSEHQQEQAQALQTIWHQTIPLSKAMNINIAYFDEQELLTHCDVNFNKNLHNTMFAGSIYTLATLTGWGWVYLFLQSSHLSADIVLADANIRYHAPVEGPAVAKTSVAQVGGDGRELQSGRNAKFEVMVEVCCGEQITATFSGLYIGIAKKKNV
jgi:thioesterase domain-containing protein